MLYDQSEPAANTEKNRFEIPVFIDVVSVQVGLAEADIHTVIRAEMRANLGNILIIIRTGAENQIKLGFNNITMNVQNTPYLIQILLLGWMPIFIYKINSSIKKETRLVSSLTYGYYSLLHPNNIINENLI